MQEFSFSLSLSIYIRQYIYRERKGNNNESCTKDQRNGTSYDKAGKRGYDKDFDKKLYLSTLQADRSTAPPGTLQKDLGEEMARNRHMLHGIRTKAGSKAGKNDTYGYQCKGDHEIVYNTTLQYTILGTSAIEFAPPVVYTNFSGSVGATLSDFGKKALST